MTLPKRRVGANEWERSQKAGPFFQEMKVLTNEQVEQYAKEGYVVVTDVFSDDLVERMRRVTDELVEQSRALTASNDVFDLAPSHTAQKPRVRRIKDPIKVDPVFMEALKHPKLIAALTSLLGPNLRVRNTKLNLKEAHVGDPVEWHQDWAFYPHTNQDVLAVGVMLDDCELENGPLLIIPDSHQSEIHSHHTDGYFCGAMDPTTSNVDFGKAVPCTGKAGSFSIHHARAIHGSAENTSNRPRRLLLYEIAAVDAWPLIGGPTQDKSLAEFNERIIAGEPTIVPRMENVPIILPLPPAPKQGSIYENQTSLKNRFFATTAEAM
ncbi:phytanoyl-CoA dioxygenase family protein [Caballeronia sp. GAFFF2]|uniref:phytanoyl-CoA dioxygenase family protein n=1 Tax=Caballeronia sp. GAFFF2 TaxID=2921741 RepID=UPI0020279275|nr:phytanoyl-CoA dioxygenase family protein [Caballeronia sp. GAFFF2]